MEPTISSILLYSKSVVDYSFQAYVFDSPPKRKNEFEKLSIKTKDGKLQSHRWRRGEGREKCNEMGGAGVEQKGGRVFGQILAVEKFFGWPGDAQ